VIVLLLSAIPYSLERRSFRITRVLAGIGVILAIITLSMMVVVRINHANDYYGKWVLDVSGNMPGYSDIGICPFVVSQDDDPRNACPHPYYVGCGLNLITPGTETTSTLLSESHMEGQDPNTYHVRNKLALGETILGLILLIPGIGGGFFILIPLSLVAIGAFIVWAVSALRDPFSVDLLDHDDMDQDELDGYKRTTARVATVAIVVVIAVSFPLHYLQQTKPTGFMILDSFGPPQPASYQTVAEGWDYGKPILYSWTGKSTKGTSWSDFFYVETPTNRWGFVEHWWSENKNRIENWLPVL
jgi:hypothetical protein